MSALLQIKDLEIFARSQQLLHLPKLELQPGEVHGLIGESGSGKSLTLLSIMQLLSEPLFHKGQIELRIGNENYHPGAESVSRMRQLRGKHVGMVFQEPLSALNPRMTCGAQILESLGIHRKTTHSEAKKIVFDAFEAVGLNEPKRIFYAFPHQISGGQRQRVMIAMATINNPTLVLADEPTTALDPETGIQVLETLVERCRSLNSALLLVSHDLPMVAKYASQLTVLQKGKCLAQGSVAALFSAQTHPYVSALLHAAEIPQHRNLSNPEVVLEVTNLSKSYPSAQGSKRVFEKLSFTVSQGETLAITGKSGSGKSTLCKILTRLENPDSGEVLLHGNSILNSKNSGIQMDFQDPYSSLNHEIKNLEIIAEVLRFKGYETKVAEGKAYDLLQSVGLDQSFAVKYPHQLSGGQRQRLCIARALASEPQLLILDEAVSALDPLVRKQVLELLDEIRWKQKVSYIFITHDPVIANEFSNQALSIAQL